MSYSDSELICTSRSNRRFSLPNIDLEHTYNPLYSDVDLTLSILNLDSNSTSSSNSKEQCSTCSSGMDNLISLQETSQESIDYDSTGIIKTHYLNYTHEGIHEGARKDSKDEGEETIDPRGCLFIAGYPNMQNEEDILEILWIEFSKWGVVDNIKLTKTSKGIPYGFVYFQNYRYAENFLDYSEQVYIKKSLLRVEDARVNRSLYVMNLTMGELTSKDKLAKKLKEYGEIESINYEEATKCFGNEGVYVIRYVGWNSAIKAYKTLKSNSDWVIEWGTRVGQSGTVGDYRIVYIDGLNSDIVCKSHLVDLFTCVGSIKCVNFINRGPASFGFVEFLNPLSSFQAVRQFNNIWWLNQLIHVHHYRRPTA